MILHNVVGNFVQRFSTYMTSFQKAIFVMLTVTKTQEYCLKYKNERYLDRIYLTEDRDQRGALLDRVLNLRQA
jgi:hypothetical protein